MIAPAISIPALFEDSTHQLWYCETELGAMVLKVCNHQSVNKSTFWLGMNTLFDMDFPRSLGAIQTTHQLLADHGTFKVPPYIASQQSSYVLSQYLIGEDVTENNVTDELISELARHLASLHQQSFTKWGGLHQPNLTSEQWPVRLQQTLLALLETHPTNIPTDLVDKVIKQMANIQLDSWTVIMPDLRWDQLRTLENGDIAVVDLDAFVIGPRELELVLLEYLLTPQQAEVFLNVYQSYLPWPDLSNQRLSYRLLLFLMNVLGETDIDKWLHHRVIV